MMDERLLTLSMRLVAVENAIAILLANECMESSDPAGNAEELRAAFVRGAKAQTFPGIDPAMSDLAAAEFEEANDRLLSMTKERVRRMQQARRADGGK